jgi:Uma2 family endonuclease
MASHPEPFISFEAFLEMLNPALIIEVLSPSTERRDRGVKLRHYQLIPSLCEYWLVSQDEALIEQYVREERGWLLRRWEEKGIVPVTVTTGMVLPLVDVYEGVAAASHVSVQVAALDW